MSNTDFLPKISVTELPSKGKTYEEGFSVEFSPYTYGEVKQVSQSSSDSLNTMKIIMKGIHTSFPIGEMTLGDFLFIGLLRKLSTLGGTEFIISTTCINPKCANHNKHSFSHDLLEFHDLSVPKLPIVAPINNSELHFSPLTVDEYLELLRTNSQNDSISVLAMQVDNHSFSESYQLISNALSDDFLILDEVDRLLFHDLEPLSVTCKACTQKYKVDLEADTDLIRPFRTDTSPTGAGIRFGLSTES